MKMLSAGLDEETVIAKIDSSPANFILDTESLIRLKSAKAAPGSAMSGFN